MSERPKTTAQYVEEDAEALALEVESALNLGYFAPRPNQQDFAKLARLVAVLARLADSAPPQSETEERSET